MCYPKLVKSGVPNVSTLVSLLFNLFINDFIYAIENSHVSKLSDDNAIYSCDDSIETILSSLKGDINDILKWFEHNRIAVNRDKFLVVLMGLEKCEKMSLELIRQSINANEELKLQGKYINLKLQFQNHFGAICKAENQKGKRVLTYCWVPTKT